MKSQEMFIKLMEHNNWSNQKMIEVCSKLTDDNLNAKPLPASEWSIRDNLIDLVESQSRYLSLLTLDPEQRQEISLEFSELEESVEQSGKELLTLLSDGSKTNYETKFQTKSQEYLVEYWVVLLQIINHAAVRREQIDCILRILDSRPPILDAWSYGRSANAVEQIPGSDFPEFIYPGV